MATVFRGIYQNTTVAFMSFEMLVQTVFYSEMKKYIRALDINGQHIQGL